MAEEGHDEAIHETPRDPMWATFRAAHPEVTLVLLPDAQASENAAVQAGDRAFDGVNDNMSLVPLDEAREARVALERKLALAAEMMQCTEVTATSGGWQSRGDSRVRPQLQLRTRATEATLRDAELIAVRLGQLGWNAIARPESKTVWVEGTIQDALVRVTVIDDWVTVRMTGHEIVVDPADAEHLIGSDGV
jgi:hypothetical protein